MTTSRTPTDALPFAEFLRSLDSVGIRPQLADYDRLRWVLKTEGRWDLRKLRGVLSCLLVKSQDQLEGFDRLFTAFFGKSRSTGVEIDLDWFRIQLERLEQDLLERGRGKAEGPQPPEGQAPPADSRPRLQSWRPWVAGALAIAAVVAALTFYRPSPPDRAAAGKTKAPQVDDRPPSGEDQAPPPSTDRAVPAVRVFERTPVFGTATPAAGTSADQAAWLAAASAVCLALLGAWLAVLGYRYRVQLPSPAPHDPEIPGSFRLSNVGPQPVRRLEDAVLDRIAQSLSYFQSEEPSETLDAERTVDATSAAAGLPDLCFEPRRELYRILVLEDHHAELRAWNPIAVELVEGLRRRGLPVVHGHFAGSPERYRERGGGLRLLRDLEERSGRYLLLIFTDSQGLGREQRSALGDLARWPRMVWMELREPRFWDAGTLWPARAGLPIFPANRAGIVEAFDLLASESQREPLKAARRRRLGSRRRTASLRAEVEEILGDALHWAHACSMIQPTSRGLADALRHDFHPFLPPERIERLLSLPGTRHTVAGLYFAPPVAALLRRSFPRQRDDREQEAVLEKILQYLDEAEPQPPGSLAHLTWQAVRERVHLELEPDVALERLSALAATPLGPAVREQLESTVLPDTDVEIDEDGDARFPLRAAPTSERARQQLARLAPHSGIRVRRFYPFRRWEKRLAWLLAAAALTTGLGYLREYLSPAAEIALTLSDGPSEAWVAVRPAGGESEEPRPLIPPMSFQIPRFAGRGDVLVEIFDDGWISRERFFLEAERHVLEVASATHAALCVEALEDWLTVLRCPVDLEAWNGPGWRRQLVELSGGALPERLLSVGIELAGEGARPERLDALRRRLLASGSVDRIYRLDASRWPAPPAGALGWIRRLLGAWSEHAQYVWWLDGAAPSPAITAYELPAPRMRLDRPDDERWAARIEALLQPGEQQVVRGEEIATALGIAEPDPAAVDVVFFRAKATAPPPVEPPIVPPPSVATEVEPPRLPAAGSSRSEPVLGLALRFVPPADDAGAGFWMAETEVTRQAWRDLMSGDPVVFDRECPRCPVERINWFQALAFVNRLSERSDLAPCYELRSCRSEPEANDYECTRVTFSGPQCPGYRLPTEAEWTHAATSGGAAVSVPANCDSEGVVEVGGRQNPWGLSDVFGNVAEWMWDPYDAAAEVSDVSRGQRVFRGGSWSSRQENCGAAQRNAVPPAVALDLIGFRLILGYDPASETIGNDQDPRQ